MDGASAKSTASPSQDKESRPLPPAEIQGKEDLYGGIRILPDSIPPDAATFAFQLAAAIKKWRAAGVKGVWLPLNKSQFDLIAVALEHGFDFHHADKAKVMMATWLPDTPSHLPANASHQVGVGVCVVDSQDRILLVQERSGPAAARGKDFWKMPTGLVDAGEDLAAAAEREVLEETGIRTRFEGVVAFRQQHKVGIEGKTDLFFLCKATPLDSKIVKQESEIAKAEWIPIHKFLSMPHFPKDSAYWFMSVLAVEAFLKQRGSIDGYRLVEPPALFKPVELPRGFMPGTNFIYSSCTPPPPSPPPTSSKL